MFRTGLGLGLVAVSIMLSGCRMCRHPYDFCGPIYDGPQGSSSWHTRAGSVLDGEQTMPAYSEEYQPTYIGDNRPGDYQTADTEDYRELIGNEAKAGDVPGSTRIVSVTDRVLGDEDTSVETSRIAENSSGGTLPSAGWTARRPTSPTRR